MGTQVIGATLHWNKRYGMRLIHLEIREPVSISCTCGIPTVQHHGVVFGKSAKKLNWESGGYLLSFPSTQPQVAPPVDVSCLSRKSICSRLGAGVDIACGPAPRPP